MSRVSVPVREKSQPLEYSRLVPTLTYLAQLHLALNKPQAAEMLLRRVLEIKARALGPEHPGVISTLNLLYGLYEEMGKDKRQRLPV